MKKDWIPDLDLEGSIGRTLQFEYYDTGLEKWVYDEDIITPVLIEASIEFKNIRIL